MGERQSVLGMQHGLLQAMTLAGALSDHCARGLHSLSEMMTLQYVAVCQHAICTPHMSREQLLANSSSSVSTHLEGGFIRYALNHIWHNALLGEDDSSITDQVCRQEHRDKMSTSARYPLPCVWAADRVGVLLHVACFAA